MQDIFVIYICTNNAQSELQKHVFNSLFLLTQGEFKLYLLADLSIKVISVHK